MMITEPQFAAAMRLALDDLSGVGCVTGPGRSGAIASVYASHILGVPFIPYGQRAPDDRLLLIIDTTEHTGKTMRKALKKYPGAIGIAVFASPPILKFWYEIPQDHSSKAESENFLDESKPK